jgi:hypothetical protein
MPRGPRGEKRPADAFAAWRLMPNSKLVGCSTGRSRNTGPIPTHEGLGPMIMMLLRTDYGNGDGFKSEFAAKLAGEKALRELLDGLAQEDI